MIECQILLKKEQNYKFCGKKNIIIYLNLIIVQIEYFEYMIII